MKKYPFFNLFSWIFRPVRSFRMTTVRVIILTSATIISLITLFIFREKITFLATKGADPVAYWKFDEGVGSTANNSGQSTVIGTLAAGSSAPTWVTEERCISGKCLRFDGVNDSVSFAGLTSPGIPYTIMFWIKPTSSTPVGIYDTAANTQHVMRNYPAGYVEWWNENPKIAMNVTANRWQHIAITYRFVGDIRYMDYYLNGSLISTVAGSTGWSAAWNTLVLGNINGGSAGWYSGLMDEVKIYNYARTSAQIKTDFAAHGTVNGVAASFGDDDLSRELSDGLVGYWNMDAGVGTTVPDLSGNNNTGTLSTGTSAPTWSAGIYGYGIEQSGAAVKYFDVSDSGDPLDMGTNNFSLSIWFKLDSLSSPDAPELIDKMVSATTGYHLRVAYSDEVEFMIKGSGGNIEVNSANSAITTGQWYHVVAVYDKSLGSKIFINGVQSGSTVNGDAGNIDNTDPFRVGIGFNSYELDGIYDEVRVYKRALDAGEAKALYEWAPGPVAYWKMDENSGTTIYDSSGNGNNSSAWAGNARWVQGKYGSATSHDGSGDRITIPSSTSLDYQPAYTWSFWLNPEEGDFQILDKAVDTNNGWTFLTNQGKYQIEINYTGDDLVCTTSASSISTGIWQHISWTWNGTANCSGIKFYKNGILLNFASTTPPTGNRENDTSKNILIGGNGYSDFQGRIDDIKIYNYARTQAQIMEDMNAGHPQVGTPIGATVGHWSLDEGYGTVAHDKSPQGNDLAFAAGSAAPTWTNDGKMSKALSFAKASSQYMSKSSASGIPSGSDPHTVTAWVKFNSITGVSGGGGEQPIISWGENSNNALRVLFVRDSKFARAYYNNDFTSNYVVTTGRWYHIIWTFEGNGNADKLYVDGKLIDSDIVNNINTTNANVTVGKYSTWYFDGTIDELKVYPFTFTADQVKQEYAGGKSIVLGSSSTGVGGTAPDNSSGREYCPPGNTETNCGSGSPAPLLHYTFNNKIGTTEYDITGNGNHGSILNGATFGNGKKGSAIAFDGINDYISVLNESNFDFSNTYFTVSGWFKLGSTSNHKYLIAKAGPVAANYQWDMWRSGSGKDVWFTLFDIEGNVVYRVDTSPLQDDTWYHIAAVYKTSNTESITVYVNGKLDTNITNNNAASKNYDPSGSTEVNIGRRGSAGATEYVNGSMDDIHIYNYQRTPAQIAWEYNRGAPVAEYKMDECTGVNIHDTSVNKTDGTLNLGSGGITSAGTCSPASGAWGNGATGKRGSSISLDGTDDYISKSDVDSLDLRAGAYSASAWIKVNTPADGIHDIILSKGGTSAATAGYFWSVNTTGKVRMLLSDGSSYLISTDGNTIISDNEWHNVTFTWNPASGYTLYIDGKQDKFVSATTSVDINSSAALLIGGRSSQNYSLNGQIDEVKIYNYALTKEQVKTEYNGGAVRFE